eukprot:scaffold90480_cov54-Phaeocystis_antarctica.AAC.1
MLSSSCVLAPASKTPGLSQWRSSSRSATCFPATLKRLPWRGLSRQAMVASTMSPSCTRLIVLPRECGALARPK